MSLCCGKHLRVTSPLSTQSLLILYSSCSRTPSRHPLACVVVAPRPSPQTPGTPGTPSCQPRSEVFFSPRLPPFFSQAHPPSLLHMDTAMALRARCCAGAWAPPSSASSSSSLSAPGRATAALGSQGSAARLTVAPGASRRDSHSLAEEGESPLLRRSSRESIWANGFDHWKAPEPRGSAYACEAVAAAAQECTAAIIDGKKIAEAVREEVRVEVERMKSEIGQAPGLAVVLVGERKDSQTYVRSKKKACEEAGIVSFGIDLPADATEEEVLAKVREVNEDPRVHGVLVQLPLPKHINEERVLGAVSLEKDVDGFHPVNIGQLGMAGREPLFVPCTPKGCIELLLRTGVEIAGKRAVVIGRSNIVGTPAAMLLQRRNATVTVVHSRTPNPEELVRQADIVVAAVGVAELVRGDWLKPGCVVIDVGINAVDDPSAKRGYRLVGDVCYEEACQVASAITPVPGGVGPMTIAMLLSNTLDAAKRANKWS